MPKTIPNYQQGKVYKMTIGDLIYIGSTCQKYLCQRLTQHANAYNYWVKNGKKYISSYELYKIGKPTITLLESYPCNSKDELLACERKYIQQFKCVNQLMKEGGPFNRKEYEKQYREQHRDLYKASYRKSYEKRRRLERLTLFIHKHIESVQNRI